MINEDIKGLIAKINGPKHSLDLLGDVVKKTHVSPGKASFEKNQK